MLRGKEMFEYHTREGVASSHCGFGDRAVGRLGCDLVVVSSILVALALGNSRLGNKYDIHNAPH